MNKLNILKTDLAIHTARLAKLQTLECKEHMLKFKRIDVGMIIPSYVKIIKSIKDELAALQSKKKKIN